MTNQVATYLKFANLQMAAEALLDQPESFDKQLTTGNKRSSKFTKAQAEDFTKDWVVIDHQSNTKTGFSGTLFKYTGADNPERDLRAGELVISFRSTEFLDDAARDNQATNAMEIKPFGWAFGQISDMEAWYAKLNTDPSKLGGGQRFSVTGYSLGGHLAAAFTQLRYEQAESTRVNATYTFNGAGVGGIKNKNSVTLTSIINQFNIDKNTGQLGGDESNSQGGGAAPGISFATPSVQAVYDSIKTTLVGGVAVTDALFAQVKAALIPSPTIGIATPIPAEAAMLLSAVERIKEIQEEAARAPLLSSGTSSGPPQTVDLTNIAGTSLNYQLAVLRAKEKTYATQDNGLLTGKNTVGPMGTFPNFFDINGDTYPGAVSHSQFHYGVEKTISIEDQPLWRGEVISQVGAASWNAGGVKLLVNKFGLNDFGDTHSLVLLVDSLSVQDSLARLDPSVTQSTLKSIFKAATNVAQETNNADVPNNQGKSEADALDNLINSLGKMLGANKQSGWKELKANPIGGQWAEVDNLGDYTGRSQFQENVKLINKVIGAKSLSGKIRIQASDTGLAGLARDDFGALVALHSLSPVAIIAKTDADRTTLETVLGEGDFSTALSQWKVDKDLSKDEKAAGKQTFTDRWMSDRAAMVSWMNYRNTKNIRSDSDEVITGQADNLSAVFNDLTTKNKITIGAVANAGQRRQVVFGDKEDNTIQGFGKDDALYGGKGDDTLKGQGGNDYLEGNEGIDNLEGGDGSDTLVGGVGADIVVGGKEADTLKGGEGIDVYKFNLTTGFGHDTIIDADGKGKIEVVGLPNINLNGSNAKKVAGQEGAWRSEDGKVTYTQVPLDSKNSTYQSGLLISFVDHPKDSILIEGWSKTRNLGIEFDPAPETPKETQTVVGDFEKDLDANGHYAISGGTYASTGQAQPSAQDYIIGGTAVESARLEGLGGNDALIGWVKDDWIDGGQGDDYLAGGGGQDTLMGGAGNDHILASYVDSKLSPIAFMPGGEQLPIPDGATLHNQGFGWAIYTEAGMTDKTYRGLLPTRQIVSIPTLWSIEKDKRKFIDAGEGDDYVISGTSSDVVMGGDGKDTMYGMDQNDTLTGEDGDDLIYGDGISSPYVHYSVLNSRHGQDVISGGGGDDTLLGNGQDDQLFGGDGKDQIWGDGQGSSDANDTAIDIQGNDYLDGGADDDQLAGGGKDDQLLGGSGNDSLWGDNSKDNLEAKHHGKDQLDGEEGDDYLEGGGADDILLGGEGNDSLQGDVGALGLKAEEYGIDLLDGGEGDDFLAGGGKGDTVLGGAGSDTLFGDGGNDTLIGGAGNDVMFGGEGDDYLEGGAGADRLNGGAGKDTYALDSQDTVTDTDITAATAVDAVDDNEGTNTIIVGGATPGNLSVIGTSSNRSDVVMSMGQDSQLYLINGVAANAESINEERLAA